jgi:hypothetical protein
MTQENFKKAEELKYKIERLKTLIKGLIPNSVVSIYTREFFFNLNELDHLLSDVLNMDIYEKKIVQDFKTLCELQLEKLELEFENL